MSLTRPSEWCVDGHGGMGAWAHGAHGHGAMCAYAPRILSHVHVRTCTPQVLCPPTQKGGKKGKKCVIL